MNNAESAFVLRPHIESMFVLGHARPDHVDTAKGGAGKRYIVICRPPRVPVVCPGCSTGLSINPTVAPVEHACCESRGAACWPMCVNVDRLLATIDETLC
jgi:hypothetical protein